MAVFILCSLYILFGLLSFLSCLIILVRIKVSDGTEKQALILRAHRLMFHSGIMLLSLHGLYMILFSYEGAPLAINDGNFSVLGALGANLLSDTLAALKWLIPIFFAGVAVNTYSHAILLPRDESEPDVEGLAAKCGRFGAIIRWLDRMLKEKQ